jgi:anti-sigma factor RsiW
MNPEVECGTDAAAYLLGAMDDTEAAAFRRHLETCPTCQAEAEVLGDTVNALPLMVAQLATPPGLRKRVMAEVNADVAAQRARRAGREGSNRRGWALPVPRFAFGVAGLAVAAVIVAIALGSSTRPSEPRVVSAAVTWQAGRAEVRISAGHGELLVTRMPAPPAGKVYEVWLQRGEAAPSPTDALFDPTRSGAAVVDVPGSLKQVRAVMVTAEPRGGSLHPTSSPVIVAKLG